MRNFIGTLYFQVAGETCIQTHTCKFSIISDVSSHLSSLTLAQKSKGGILANVILNNLQKLLVGTVPCFHMNQTLFTKK